jgi:phosphoribosylaminoimidazolecarboxamide formyltransferase/IMP cyclohydrolase
MRVGRRELAWRVCGHVKSNAIVLAKDGVTWGIGAGQQNRVESGELATNKAAGRATGGACASDAFYPSPTASRRPPRRAWP